MTKEELTELRLIRNEPCISIIIPTFNDTPEHEKDLEEVDSAVNTAITKLLGKYGEEKVTNLLHKLKRVAGSIDYADDSEGLGIFLSKDVSKVIRFPFPVKEKVFVGEEFETRDLLYSTKSLYNYYFLLLNKNVIRLFKGYGDMISEVVDENFPKLIYGDVIIKTDESSGTVSYTLIERIENNNFDERSVREFLQDVDYLLFLYLKKDTPFFVAGSPQYIHYYEHITQYSRNIVSLAQGEFENSGICDIKQVVNNELKKYTDSENELIIKGFQEMISSGRVIWSIAGVWKAAIEGKISNLLVEKDYMCRTAVSKDWKSIYFNINTSNPDQIELDDVINDLIELVIEKGGDIIFVQNGKLAKYDNIAAILRNKD